MFSKFRTLVLVSPAVLGAMAIAPLSAIANEVNTNTGSLDNVPGTFNTLVSDVDENTEGQVTSVSQLSDVQPTDWAYQALQSLVERYGCIAGYPNGTFRGNRAATRYELAAALNACLDQISDRFATKEDLEAVKALQEEFKAELATLKGRVDSLEARTATLEAQQFSTTTKLKGEAVFIVSDVFSEDRDVAAGPPTAPGDNDARPVFSNRVRLNFDTSFTGKDQLRVRLQARNIQSNSAASGTNMTRLSVDGNENNAVTVDDLFYKFPIGKNLKATVMASSADFYTHVNTYNPFLASDGTGSISRFGRFNPIFRVGERTPAPGATTISGGANSAGAVLNYKFNDKIGLSVGYVANSANNSVGPIGGLAGGSYSALAQLELQPTKNFGFGVAYVHSFQEAIVGDSLVDLQGGTGSAFSRAPFGQSPTTSDSVGLQFSWKVSQRFNVSGWAGYTKAREDIGASNREADIINWSAQFAFPDLFKKGNLGAIVVGQQPYVFNQNFVSASDPNSNFHVEGLYRFQINDYISVTPGVIVVINGENNSQNSKARSTNKKAAIRGGFFIGFSNLKELTGREKS
jgi:hypothetical protein